MYQGIFSFKKCILRDSEKTFEIYERIINLTKKVKGIQNKTLEMYKAILNETKKKCIKGIQKKTFRMYKGIFNETKKNVFKGLEIHLKCINGFLIKEKGVLKGFKRKHLKYLKGLSIKQFYSFIHKYVNSKETFFKCNNLFFPVSYS